MSPVGTSSVRLGGKPEIGVSVHLYVQGSWFRRCDRVILLGTTRLGRDPPSIPWLCQGGSRSIRMVNRSVASAPDVHRHRRRATFPRLNVFWRSRPSSLSSMCVVPALQLARGPLRTLTLTRGLAAILRTQSAARPRWESSQKVSPSSPSQTGVTRGCRLRRPIVSRRASPGSGMPTRNAHLTSGFTTPLWMGCRMRFTGRDG